MTDQIRQIPSDWTQPSLMFICLLRHRCRPTIDHRLDGASFGFDTDTGSGSGTGTGTGVVLTGNLPTKSHTTHTQQSLFKNKHHNQSSIVSLLRAHGRVA